MTPSPAPNAESSVRQVKQSLTGQDVGAFEVGLVQVLHDHPAGSHLYQCYARLRPRRAVFQRLNFEFPVTSDAAASISVSNYIGAACPSGPRVRALVQGFETGHGRILCELHRFVDHLPGRPLLVLPGSLPWRPWIKVPCGIAAVDPRSSIAALLPGSHICLRRRRCDAPIGSSWPRSASARRLHAPVEQPPQCIAHREQIVPIHDDSRNTEALAPGPQRPACSAKALSARRSRSRCFRRPAPAALSTATAIFRVS